MTITPTDVKNSIPDMFHLPRKFRLEIDMAHELWKTISLPMQRNYYDDFRQPLRPIVQQHLKSYLEDNEKCSAYTDSMCPEAPLPALLKEAFTFTVDYAAEHIEPAMVLLHAGRSGCVSQLHFDWDHEDVLHVCMSGTKTFYLIPPNASWLLSPIVNTSALCLPRFSEKDIDALLTKTGGERIILQAGDAVFFPSIWWHAVGYETPSLAASIRFSGPIHLRPFKVLPRSWWLQRIVWYLFQNKTNNQFLTSILTQFFAENISWEERYIKLNHYYQQWLREQGQEFGATYWMGDNFNTELALADFELASLYTPVRQTMHTEEKVREIEEYLFSAYTGRSLLTRALAIHALASAHGLSPTKGTIPIHKYHTHERITHTS